MKLNNFSTGKYEVLTETARYTLNFDLALVTRELRDAIDPDLTDASLLTPEQARLRGDNNALILYGVSPVEIGKPMMMSVQVAQDGVWTKTFRQTTNVRKITELSDQGDGDMNDNS